MGPNIVELKKIDEMVEMILRAKGTKGICADYVKRVAAQLERLGINDAAVTSLAEAIPVGK